ncbi:MAG: Clp protease N-terminal domain-containing protein, partial [Nitrospinota bacterium]|nr:Clp protease N-terminal domain-containing protein [Nitrospinota bacterium]
MNQAVLPLLQPTNNTEIQKKISNAPEAKEGNFSDVFDNAVKEQSISQKDGTANKISEKKSEVLNTSSKQVKLEKTSNAQNSDLELSETVSAKEFLEKLGLDEDAIQEILQINELNENSTLLELLNNLSLTLDNQDNFLKTPAIDFFKMLGIEGEKIEEIFQQIAGQSEKSKTDISVKNLFENIGLGLEKYTAVEMDDLSVENFFQKLGLNEKESLNLIKELGIGKSLNDPALLNVQETDAKDLLKQMGLNSDEITKIIEKSIKNSDDKSKIKDLILNKDFSTLKKLVSSEKFNINSSGKSDFQGMFQA